MVAVASILSCNHPLKSYDAMFREQQELFNENKPVFERTVRLLDSSPIADTTLTINDPYLKLPNLLADSLRSISIFTVSLYKKNCRSKDIWFEPDSLWFHDAFSVIQIRHDPCDERSRKGYHWKHEQSDHKHSIGQGDGWFIYTDTDRDPF